MMHRPASSEILKQGQSYYSLVIAVAKRAREITEKAEAENIEMTEKAVKIAVEEFAKNKYKLIEPEGIGEEIEQGN